MADERDTFSSHVAENFARRFAPPELYDERKRREWKLGRDDSDPGPYVIELNLQHIEGVSGALAALEERLGEVIREQHQEDELEDATRRARPRIIAKTYVRCLLTVAEWKRLLELDGIRAGEETAREREQLARAATRASGAPPAPVDPMRFRAVYKLWPDFPLQSQVHRSVATIKADAAFKSFGAAGTGIVWAVIDSGIDSNHPHFESNGALSSPEVKDLHRCFVDVQALIPGIDVPFLAEAPEDPDQPSPRDEAGKELTAERKRERRRELIEKHREFALTDDFGHGTHVAGIIAGRASPGREARLLERVDRMNGRGELERGDFQLTGTLAPDEIRGVAPNCRLVSLRVLDDNGEGRSSDVIRALDYVREKLNDNPKLLRVHGVNLSVGYDFDAEMFACGQSPICAEVNRLVQSGVVVVTAAGNTGYGTVSASVRPTKVGLANTINDPGNAELAITVGATHRDSPYTYGVSYFSSKGPTGDGRLKPDLVAPGERITSCGAGKRLEKAKTSAGLQADGAAYYLEDSGTSMAAPHVSGAIAAFLSIRREFIGKPLDVKRIFVATASPLGRERYFEGHGLLDLIRAIQSV